MAIGCICHGVQNGRLKNLKNIWLGSTFNLVSWLLFLGRDCSKEVFIVLRL